MSTKNVVLSIIAVAALGAAAYITIGQSSDKRPPEESMERPAYLVCQNAECKNEFEMTMRELVDARAKGGPPECPECGQRKNRLGHKCEGCARIVMRVGHAELPPECPYCGYDFVKDKEALQETQDKHRALDALEINGG